MKSYTNLRQGKELSKILPLETADMMQDDILVYPFNDGTLTPCWSLTTLLGVLPSSSLSCSYDFNFKITCRGIYSSWYNNPIDACYELITKNPQVLDIPRINRFLQNQELREP